MMQHKFLRGDVLFLLENRQRQMLVLSPNLTDLWLVPSVLWDRDTLERLKKHLGGVQDELINIFRILFIQSSLLEAEV